jgi:hypothetical protein
VANGYYKEKGAPGYYKNDRNDRSNSRDRYNNDRDDDRGYGKSNGHGHHGH